MTAIEWLYEQLNGLNKPILDDYFQTVFMQAKEIEKQQIIDAYHINPLESKWKNIGEQYYNQTFNKQ